MRRSMFALALLIVFVAQRAHAQLGVESVLKDVNDINFFFTCWRAQGEGVRSSDCPDKKRGFGLEVSYEAKRIEIGSLKRHHPEERTPVAEEEECAGGRCTTKRSYTIKKAHDDPVRYIIAEVALGYSQYEGFESTSGTQELRGLVRELPSVSFYGTYVDENYKGRFARLSPYFGVRTGLIQLSNTSIVDRIAGDTLVNYSASASTFQFGVVGGMVYRIGDRVNAFAEYAQMLRRFPNVQWAAAGTNKTRSDFPRGISFSGPALAVGVQFTLREPNP